MCVHAPDPKLSVVTRSSPGLGCGADAMAEEAVGKHSGQLAQSVQSKVRSDAALRSERPLGNLEFTHLMNVQVERSAVTVDVLKGFGRVSGEQEPSKVYPEH